ncbi:Ig-like domain-containing protein [bacterium]|nr:Ig-like domain-containing protein [bacterium]
MNYKYLIISIFSLLFLSCEDRTPPEVSIIFPPSGGEFSGILKFEIDAYDDSGVSQVDFFLSKYFGRWDIDPTYSDLAPPWEYICDTRIYKNDRYCFWAEASDGFWNSQVTNKLDISLKNRFQVRFYNSTVTNISTDVEGFDGQVLFPGDSVIYTFPGFDNPNSVTYSANTTGIWINGNTSVSLGNELKWISTAYVANMGSLVRTFFADKSQIFIFLTNEGNHTIGPFYVNYGADNQTVSEIYFPPDGVEYSTGYFDAIPLMEIRIESENDDQPYILTEGQHFSLSHEPNQILNIGILANEVLVCKVRKDSEAYHEE